ncbi:MAG: TaqI-like C-terminal specificity domain-containing protein [Lachnospiraceae bacterium]|nr:N-6 DNA methylase [Lachnospiraceae bacterium]MDY3224049.1 TaqI-like C-terminal specificity domain-containing protein [Lachnospiraceae bacterium]
MTEVFSEIEGFISNALTCLNSYFKNGIKTNEIEIDEVYPYLFRDYETKKILYKGENVFEDLGILYESLIPISLKKDFGLFYTREDTILKMMVDSVEVLSGEILEPACGSGLFLVKIIEKIVLELKRKGIGAEEILDYICDNIHANDNDRNAVVIAEINMLATLLPLIICAKRDNPNYVMKPLKVTCLDFTKKNIFKKEYSLVIGNPPFVTMYGKRSRNMTEEKRAYFNTFDFVQNKKGNNKFNLSMFFIENGLKTLINGGRLVFILDIAFFETAFIDIRKYIVNNFYINSLTTGLQAFEEVASGQLIIDITNSPSFNDRIKLLDYVTQEMNVINQSEWNNSNNKYKFNAPLSEMQKEINSKIVKYDMLEKYFPKKALRTCCALTGKTEEFVVNPDEENECMTFPYIEGSKGLKGKFFSPTPNRYIKYDYGLQLRLSNEFKNELEALGVKNKKRVTLGDKDAYLSPKIFIRQSATEIIATYCSEPYAANNSIYILTTKENTEKSIDMLKYTCGLLNSDLITFYCRINKIIRAEKGKTPQIKISDLKEIRINVDNVYFDSIVDLVEKLLESPKDKLLYERLNSLVYEIYNINEREREFITEYLMA